LENALLARRDMRFERARDDEFLPTGDHSTAARAGTDAQFARIKHQDVASRGRQLDGCRQAAVPATDDGNVHPLWKRRLGRGLGACRLPPVGGRLQSGALITAMAGGMTGAIAGTAGSVATAHRSPLPPTSPTPKSCTLDHPRAHV